MDILGLIALAKSQNGGSVSKVFHFKGVKSAANLLPIQGEEGDVYKVEGDSYYAWDGTNWVDIGEVLSVDEAEELIDGIQDDIQNIKNSIAEEFDESKVYTAASYVMYEGKLYIILDDHQKNVSWANTVKIPYSVGAMLRSFNNGFQTYATNNDNRTADYFRDGTENAEGSYVIYNHDGQNKLWYLPNGHALNVTWANTPHTEVKLTDEIIAIKNAINDLGGGTTGQFLVKTSGTDYDFSWVTVPSANGVSF